MTRVTISSPSKKPTRTVAGVEAKKAASAAEPVSAVIKRAEQMGLMTASTQHVGARLPVKLLEQARKRTGLASTTDLLSFALANVAVEDGFAKAFVAARGKLDGDIDIGF